MKMDRLTKVLLGAIVALLTILVVQRGPDAQAQMVYTGASPPQIASGAAGEVWLLRDGRIQLCTLDGCKAVRR